MDLGGGDMDWLRGRVFLKPEDQLVLSDAVCAPFHYWNIIHSNYVFLRKFVTNSKNKTLGITRRDCKSSDYT